MLSSIVSFSQEYPRLEIDSLGNKVVVFTLEQAQKDLTRMRDRVGMMEWKSRPPHNYVVVQEEIVTTHTIL